MDDQKSFSWFGRSIAYTITINLLTFVVMLLYAQNIIQDITSLILLFVVFIISASIFSCVKGDSVKPLLYNVSVFVTHIILSLVIIACLGLTYTGWETTMFFWAEIFLMIFFVSVLLLDTILYLMNK